VTRTVTASSSSRAERDGRRAERRTAVIDLGSNSFRLVVYTSVPGSWWKRTDEIHEGVRIGQGLGAAGELSEAAMTRALRTIELYAHFCRASALPSSDVHAVATSAIRDARNGEAFLGRARGASGLDIRVLSPDEEAWFGYLAAVNSTTLEHGVVLDVGGGSIQLVEVRHRHPGALGSWPLGAVRMTERFLPGESASKKQLRALRSHVREQLDDARWLPSSGPRLVAIGGTARNLAAALQRREGLPGFGVQGFVLERDALDELVADLAGMKVAERATVPGIKPQRGDLILAGAVVLRAVMEAGEFEAVEVTEAGLREGVFLALHLAPEDPPFVDDVRASSVRNLAAQYDANADHARHVALLSLQLFDALAAAGLHDGDAEERELLRAAALLHDIGVTVDYDDHHKHSRYLVLNAGLPGFTPRETALIAQMARYHRKGTPTFGELEPLTRAGDLQILERGASLLRLAESLERSRDQIVERAEIELDDDGLVILRTVSREDASVARWVAERHVDQFERAFGRPLSVLG
jgi:exopolyphosphatase / guanosine-5'-triphosphate,3'-diphosphate pyrophosphatase